MLKTLLFTLILMAVCIILLSVKLLLQKNGRFPNSHVSGSKAMRKRGIGCVQSQDREARQKPRFDLDKLEQSLQNNQTI